MSDLTDQRRAQTAIPSSGLMGQVARGMLFTYVIVGVLSLASAKPLLITRHTDGVQLKSASAVKSVGASPAVLQDGQALIIPEGGFVILLSEGRALKISGPKTITTSDEALRGVAPESASGSSALGRVLGRQSSELGIAATRSLRRARIKHPIRSSDIAQLSMIVIECNECSGEMVYVTQQADARGQEKIIWHDLFKPQLTYSGPMLPPGEYLIKIAKQTHPFRVASADRVANARLAIEASLRLAQSLSVADRASIRSAIWHQSRMPSEAFVVLSRAVHEDPDNQALRSMLKAYQRALNTRQFF